MKITKLIFLFLFLFVFIISLTTKNLFAESYHKIVGYDGPFYYGFKVYDSAPLCGGYDIGPDAGPGFFYKVTVWYCTLEDYPSSGWGTSGLYSSITDIESCSDLIIPGETDFLKLRLYCFCRDWDNDGHYRIWRISFWQGKCPLGPEDDCNDRDPTVYGAQGCCTDKDGDGYFLKTIDCPQGNDCSDTDSSVFPGAPEICDGKDNNCNGEVDELCCNDTDNDGDGHFSYDSCLSPNDDCDDNDPSVFSGAPEVCDGKDNNCDGQVDEGCCAEIESFTGSSSVIAPSAGGWIDFSASISNPSGSAINWTLSLPGKEFTGTTESFTVHWDGRDSSGKLVEPGSYVARLTVRSGGCVRTEEIPFKVEWTEDCKLNISFGSTANIASGNLHYSQSLFQLPNTRLPLEFTLTYNSLDGYNGPLGTGWRHTYDITLRVNNDGTFTLIEGDGRRTVFYKKGDYYTPKPSGYPELRENPDGTYKIKQKDGITYAFNPEGKITAITDRNGNSITLNYDIAGNLVDIIDTSGRVITIDYDENNRITTITDPMGNVYKFTYRNDALVTVSTQNPNSETLDWTYTYDENGFLLTRTDPPGYTTRYTYDEDYRVVQSIDPEGNIRTITYSSGDKTTTVTEPDGGEWIYRYDSSLGVLIEKIDPEGNTTKYTYDKNRNLISETDPLGNTTTYTYDGNGNVISVTDPEGNTTTYTYNEFSQITSITEPDGNITRYTYDEKGNLVSITDPTGATTRYQYDSKGNITAITNPNNQTTTFTYDQYGNLTSITDPTGATTKFTYDAAGNMLSQTDPEGNTTRFEYNSLNQLIKVIDPLGNVTTYTYDALGRRTSVTDANGNTTHYEYNHRGQLIKVTDALGNVTTYTYGGSGCSSCGGGADRLTSITDASGNTTTYEYDTLGRLIKETDPLGNTITYTYDAKGNLISKTDANGNTILYTYDPLGRLTKKTYPDSTTEVFQYDEKGNIIYAGNQYIAYEFTRDAKGRVLSVTDSRGLTTQYEYDLSGNRVKMVTPEGETITYTYDSNNRLKKIDSWAGSFNFTYDSTGRRTSLRYPNGVTTTYEYDSSGHLIELLTRDPRLRILNSYTYTLDNVGNRLTKTETDRKYTYTYDAIYRLLEAIPEKLKHRHRGMGKGHGHGNKPEHYTYDPVGNRLTGPDSKDYYFYNQGNQLIEDRKYLYEYDRNGNLVRKTAIDNDGEEKVWSYYYDYENRLIKVVKEEEDEIRIVTFKYDPFGRRIEKKIEDIEDGEVKEVKIYTYVYDNEDIIFEYVSVSGHEEDGHHDSDDRGDHHPHHGRRYNKHHKDRDFQYVIKYLHGPGIDEPLAIKQKGRVYYYHADGLGSITALTDYRRRIVQRYEYDSFGNMKHRGHKVKQPYTFTGREWDGEIGLYYYRARYYDPKVGRFITEDPIGFKGGINLYVYVANNPIINVDTFGLKVINGMDCTEIGRFQIPVIFSGDPYQTYNAGNVWICTEIIIEDTFSCVCSYEKNERFAEIYRKYVAFEVTYRCNCNVIIKKIETQRIADEIRYLYRPTGIVRHVSGNTTAAFGGCSCALEGIGQIRTNL